MSRQDLEKRTRNQADNLKWQEARRYRITGSKCDRILEQHTRTEALPMLNPLPKPIAWGRKNEEKARKSYVHCALHE